MIKHGYSAFAEEDREDARQRMPAWSLESWAARHGLEHHGRASLAGFRPVLPEHLEDVHSLVRGPLPGAASGSPSTSCSRPSSPATATCRARSTGRS